MNMRARVLLFSAVALLWSLSVQAAGLVVISELLRDPAGRESEIPGGRSHEFVEFVNLTGDTLTLDSLYLGDRRDSDEVVPERLGWTGEALTDLRPAGKALFNGESLDVVADGDFISKGSRIRVTDEDGMKIVVREI